MKVRFYPTKQVREENNKDALRRIEDDALAALKKAGAGPNIFYLKFWSENKSFCLASKENKLKETVDIEFDVISPGMTDIVITNAQHNIWTNSKKKNSSGSFDHKLNTKVFSEFN